MCLIAVAWKIHPDYPLVLCANRDEYYARPSQAAHTWPDYPHIFAGRDLQEGGSWMGISQLGRFSAVTNIRNPQANLIDAKSRGLLVSQYLDSKNTAIDFCHSLQSEAGRYNGYNFLAYDGDSLIYQSNYTDQPTVLMPGIYAVSNATLDITWPKTRSAVAKLKQWLDTPDTVDQLAQLLNDRSSAPDKALPRTGVSLELERVLSAEFIDLPEYGTRCSTGVLVHRSGRAEYCEISHDQKGAVSQQVIENFQV